jgi:thymidylate synthase (FAD)
MRIVDPGFTILTPIDGDRILRSIEAAGRTCYKSEDKITESSAKRFVAMVLARGHESVIEHESISVRIVCDRGVSHEIVRHRLASYSQESTRYCRYTHEIEVIEPPGLGELSGHHWGQALKMAEGQYLELLALGTPQEIARSVLPNALKTEIVMTCNLREWRHFFKLRTAKEAHPQMREIARPMLAKFRELIPVIFDGVGVTQ